MSSQDFLDIGCGTRPHPDATHFVDKHNVINNENFTKWDLNVFPYPFKDASFEVVYARAILEHVRDPIKMLNEMYRISRRKVVVIVPHYSSYAAHNHIEHVNFFGSNSFSTFYEGDLNYGEVRWIGKHKITLYYAPNRRLLKWLNPLMNFLINIRPLSTERYLMPLVWGGIDEVKFEFWKEVRNEH